MKREVFVGRETGSSLLFLLSFNTCQQRKPGESHGWRSLVAYSPWGCKESDMTEWHHFFSHPYMTTGKTIGLTRWIFVGKVMSLLLHVLSRLVITSLPRSKHLLISWLQSPSAVILEPKKLKVALIQKVCQLCSWNTQLEDTVLIDWYSHPLHFISLC